MASPGTTHLTSSVTCWSMRARFLDKDSPQLALLLESVWVLSLSVKNWSPGFLPLAPHTLTTERMNLLSSLGSVVKRCLVLSFLTSVCIVDCHAYSDLWVWVFSTQYASPGVSQGISKRSKFNWKLYWHIWSVQESFTSAGLHPCSLDVQGSRDITTVCLVYRSVPGMKSRR